MKRCKYCNEELDKNIKYCTKCGKKQKKLPTWAIVVIVILVLIGVSSGGDSTSDTKKVSSSNTSSKEEKMYNVGDTITTKKYEITITSVKEVNTVGNEYFNKTPSEGATFVAVDFKYKNISSKPIGMFSFPSLKLLDSSNTKYSNDIDASSYYATETDPDRKIVSDLNPGITVTNSEVFEISSESYNSGSWKLLVDADQDFYVKIK